MEQHATEIRKYRTKIAAQRYAKALAERWTDGGFEVVQHPYDFGFAIIRRFEGGHAYVCRGRFGRFNPDWKTL